MATEDLEINIGANTQDLQNGLAKATQSVKDFGTTVQATIKPTGDATQSLVNFCRIAQDAPYGFIGIANNLNPMLESFQRLQKEAGGTGEALKSMVSGLMGPAGLGLALGVVSSLIVAFGKDIKEYMESIGNAGGATKEMKTSLEAIGGEFTSAVEKVDKVKIAFEEYHKGVLTGDQALKIYNDTLGKNLGVKSNINEAEKVYKEKTAAYVEASFQRALADAASKKAAEELLKQRILQAEGPKNTFTDYAVGIGMGNFDFSDKIYKDVANVHLKESVEESNKLINQYKKIAEDAKIASDTIAKSMNVDLDPSKTPKTKKEAKTKQDVDTSDLDVLKKEQKLYADDIYVYKEYADKIAAEQRNVALEKAKINKAGNAELMNIEKEYGIQLELNKKELGDNLTKMFKSADDKWIKQEQERNKKLLQESIDFNNNRIKEIEDEVDVEEKLAGKSYEKKKQAVKKGMAEFAAMASAPGVDPKSMDHILAGYDKLEKKLKILDIDEQKEKADKLHESYRNFGETLSKGVTEGLVTMWDAMQKGENPLKAITDMIMKMVEQLAAAVVQALLFKAIMSVLDPTAAVGGAAGAGGGLLGGIGKMFGFAEGGIVSRPTVAMVGEGGQSEAIMPLNKLGNMMNSTFNAGAMSGHGGGGSGQFTLKGNDLVLALQRSNYSLNLRRGS